MKKKITVALIVVIMIATLIPISALATTIYNPSTPTPTVKTAVIDSVEVISVVNPANATVSAETVVNNVAVTSRSASSDNGHQIVSAMLVAFGVLLTLGFKVVFKTIRTRVFA